MTRKTLVTTLALAGVLLAVGALCARSEASEPAAAAAAKAVAAGAAAVPPSGGLVTGAQAQALQQAGAAVVDVRTAGEYAAGHVPGALHVPFDEIARRAADLPAEKDAPLVVYCRSGRRSGIATEALRQLGYTRVYDFQRASDWPGPLAQ